MRAWLLVALLSSCGCAIAADGLTPEQQRLRACNTEAKHRGLKAAERSRFITDCLNRRKLDGEDRRKFVAGCLDGSVPST